MLKVFSIVFISLLVGCGVFPIWADEELSPTITIFGHEVLTETEIRTKHRDAIPESWQNKKSRINKRVKIPYYDHS